MKHSVTIWPFLPYSWHPFSAASSYQTTNPETSSCKEHNTVHWVDLLYPKYLLPPTLSSTSGENMKIISSTFAVRAAFVEQELWDVAHLDSHKRSPVVETRPFPSLRHHVKHLIRHRPSRGRFITYLQLIALITYLKTIRSSSSLRVDILRHRGRAEHRELLT